MKNANRWAPGGARPYAAALAAILLAFAIRSVLQPVLGEHFSYSLFTTATIVIAAYGGYGPALVVVASGWAIGTYFFVPPYGALSGIDLLDVARLGGYLLMNVSIVFLIEWLQRSRYEARINLQVARQNLEALHRKEAELRRALQLAQQTQRTLQALAAAAPTIWHIQRLDSRFKYVNDEFYRLTGLPPGSLEAEGWTKAMHPDDVELMKAIWQRVADTGDREVAELRFQMADGTYRVFRGWVQRVDDKHGPIVKWTGA
jgi:PAS domain S-box-containing protein